MQKYNSVVCLHWTPVHRHIRYIKRFAVPLEVHFSKWGHEHFLHRYNISILMKRHLADAAKQDIACEGLYAHSLEKKLVLSLQMWTSHVNCSSSLSTKADHLSASKMWEAASRSDMHSTKKCGWNAFFLLGGSGHWMSNWRCLTLGFVFL